VVPVAFNVAFGMLAARFDSPDILRPHLAIPRGMLDTRNLRLLEQAADGRLRLGGVRWLSALPQTSASGTFRLRHSVGVWA
jgi:hypothetical protein